MAGATALVEAQADQHPLCACPYLPHLAAPPQLVNFSVVPLHLRIPFVAGVSFAWTVILSVLRGALAPAQELVAATEMAIMDSVTITAVYADDGEEHHASATSAATHHQHAPAAAAEQAPVATVSAAEQAPVAGSGGGAVSVGVVPVGVVVATGALA